MCGIDFMDVFILLTPIALMPGVMEVMIIFLFLMLISLILIPYILFLVHLYKLLSKCKQENRDMEPGLVWLNLIPVFNYGWIFYSLIKIRDALKKEYSARNLATDDREFSFSIGLAYCITQACSIIPFLGLFSALASLVLWIIYWVKTNNYSKQLDAID